MFKDFTILANTLRNEHLFKTEDLLVKNKQAWVDTIAKHFQAICDEIKKLQTASELSAISYLEYTMLYNNFINWQYETEIFVYSSESYLDKKQRIIASYDISALFVYYNELWDKLLSARKRFAGQVSAQDIKLFMLQTLPDFYSYFTKIVRFAVAGCIPNERFADIIKNDVFMINVGEYMGLTEPIYTEIKYKDVNKLIEWFQEKAENEYTFGDYSNLDFSDCIFKKTDFRYASFCGSCFKNASLAGSYLNGANFRNADMEGCLLDSCTIYETDFSHAMLKNASFVGVYAQAGLLDEKYWQFPGFLPVNFRNADLTGTNFTRANLKGADFSGAVLTDTIFTDAVLDDAIFGDVLPRVAVLDEAVFSGSICGKAELMRYYVMEPTGNVLLPAAPKGKNAEIVLAANLSRFSGIDYDARNELISDRFKLLMEQYLTEYDYQPVVFFDKEKEEQLIFWRFRPDHYTNYQATFRSDGVVSSISLFDNNAPVVFTARSPRGVRSIVVRIAVTESALRRGFFGVKFTKVSDS
jgi:uncharacterized protein YjbI with pentapeptide repeats